MDTLILQESWSYDGVSNILSGFPLLPSFIIVSLMNIAFGLVVDGFASRNVTFSTTTERRPFNSKGRRYANKESYQTIPSWVRERCIPPGSFEIDAVNCHPSILANFCKDKCTALNLDNYVTNREYHLTAICEILGIDRDFAKRIILVVIQGRDWRYYVASKLSIRPERVRKCQFLDNLQGDIAEVRSIVLNSNQASDIKELLKKQPVFEKWSQYKIQNMMYSIFLEQKEREIMDTVIVFAEKEFGIKPCTLMHDGFIVDAKTILEGEFIKIADDEQLRIPVETLILAIEEEILLKTGMNIKMAVKPCCNPAKADVMQGAASRYRSTSFRNIREISDDYVRVPKFEGNEKCIAVKAGMRAGKTTALVNFLKTTVSSNERVLLTTCRIQQALSLIGAISHIDAASGTRISDITACDGIPFKVFLYREKEESLSSSSPGIYICQWESLHCLIGSASDTYRSFDYVINDEIRSTLNQACVGITNREFLRINMHIFRDICLKTKCLLFDADLLIDGMVERFCMREFGGLWNDDEIRVEIYSKQSMPRQFTITDDRIKFTESLLASVQRAKSSRLDTGRSVPVFIACRSKRGLMDLLTILTGKSDPDFLFEGIAYFSSSSTTAQMALWENIDKFISDNIVDVVITTSKVTVCADMKSKVTECFILGNSMGGCHARDLFQTIGRARDPLSENITILVNTPNERKSAQPDFNDIKDSMLQDATLRRKYLTIIETEVGFDIEDEHKFNRLVIQRSPDWMVHLACDTELEVQNNRSVHFHSSLIRIANYKGWRVSFEGKPSPEDNAEIGVDNLKAAHKIAGEEIKAHDERILSELKVLPLEELTVMSKARYEDGPSKEKAFVASFLVRFAGFIPSITLQHKKYYVKNHGVFDRCMALEADKDKLYAVDLSRMLKSTNKGIMERCPLLLNAVNLLGALLVNVIGLNYHESFIDAPIEEKKEKDRVLEDYDIGKIELSKRFEEIQLCSIEIFRNLGMLRTQRKTIYKDTGLGACKIVDSVLKLFGRKLESCKDRSLDQRVYRIVKDEDFSVLFSHYIAKEHPEHVRDGIKSMMRYAKRENPHLLKAHQEDRMVIGSNEVNSKEAGKKRRSSLASKNHIDISRKRQAQQHVIDGGEEKKDVDLLLLDLLEQT